MQITLVRPVRVSRLLGWPLAAGYTGLLIYLTGLGFALRLVLLDRFPLRADEAIYSFWALHGWRADPLFLHVWPDKPPIFIWLLGAAFQLFGVSQASARLINVLISTLTIVVVAAIARCLWGKRSAAIAALTFALSPFAISFAPTVYTDPLLVLAGSLAILMALRRLPWWAGLWLGVAMMTKQQGVLYAPLIVALLLWSPRQEAYGTSSTKFLTSQALRFVGGVVLVVLPILYWDSLRWAVAPSPWDLSIRNYGALRLASWQDWLPRAKEWFGLAWYLAASWPVWITMAVLGTIRGFVHLRRRVRPNAQPPITSSPHHSITLPPATLIALWAFGFLILHITTTVQPWDRYLLPLAPIFALASGRWLAAACAKLPNRWLAAILMAWLLGLTPPALAASGGRLPVGGDHGAYVGLTEALDWLKASYPQQRIILYHHNLGWHYRFYLYDEVAVGAYDLRWFPYAVYLADNAVKAPQRPKILIQPAWASIRDLALQLQVRGLQLRQRARFGQFTVYEIEQPEQGYCTWCLCRPTDDRRALGGAHQ